MALVVRNLPANAEGIREAGFILGLGRSPGGGHGNPLQYSCLENPRDGCIVMASQFVLVVKNLPANAGDAKDEGSIPGLGRSPGGGHSNPLQHCCLKNPHGQRSLAGYSP